MRAFHRTKGTRYSGKTVFSTHNRLYGCHMGPLGETWMPKIRLNGQAWMLHEVNTIARTERCAVSPKLEKLPNTSSQSKLSVQPSEIPRSA